MGNILNIYEEVVRNHPDKRAITHYLSKGRSNEISYKILDERSDEMARHLMSCGIQQGDFVGIYMRKTVDHVTAILGILKAGGIFYSLNSRTRLPQVKYISSLTQSKVLLVDDYALLILNNIDNIADMQGHFIYFSTAKMSQLHKQIFEKVRAVIKLKRFDTDQSHPPRKQSTNKTVLQDPAFTLFTSGSTGTPKGVLISHQDLCNRVETECGDYKITHKDCLLSLLPFSFDVGCNQLFTALASGARLVILNSWLPKDICAVINEYGVTGISGVPAIWAGMLENHDDELEKALNQVRYITVSGGDLSPHQLKQLKRLSRQVSIYKTYGQTETFRSAILMPHEYEEKRLSVGRAVKGTEVFVLNKDGHRALANEVGEVVHRGDGMMMGYVGESSETKKKIRAHPLHGKNRPYPCKVVFTGDIGMMDEGGYLTLMGRKDKMIKSSGHRIYPKEIVDQILLNESVKDAVVFGVKDPKSGDAIYCEIEAKNEQNVSESEIKAFLSDKLPSYMIPTRVFFTPSFSRTASGKIKLAEVEKKYNG